jgi:hypothetical protein
VAECDVWNPSTVRAVRCCADRAEESDADVTDWDAGMVIASPDSCTELGWGFKYGNTAVCGESILQGICHASTATFSDAVEICSEAGGRLCTLAEVETLAVSGTGCAIDSLLIWTQTQCSQGPGMFVRTGRFYDNIAAECESNGLTKLSVRCCGDKISALGSGGDQALPAATTDLTGTESVLFAMLGFGVALFGAAVVFAVQKTQLSVRQHVKVTSQRHTTMSTVSAESMDPEPNQAMTWDSDVSVSWLHRRLTSAAGKV